jgi:membrane protein
MATLDSFIRSRLWPDDGPRSRWGRGALIVARYVYALSRELGAGEISLRAVGLVYTTMLAVVPLLAFSFSVAKGLGVHRQLEPLLQRFLQPLGPQGNQISTSVIGFVDNVSGSVLAVLSIALLLLTALSMAQKIESSFNYVWRVDRPRSFVRRISDYLSVIFLGPVVMIFATGVVAALSSSALLQRLSAAVPFGNWLARLEAATPYVIVCIAFALLYMITPNTRVRLRPALIGAACGGIAWVSAGRIFAATIVSSTRFEAIYSGFAIVVILMLWLHISWLILLLGSQLAYFVQHPYQLQLPRRSETLDNRVRERLALSIMFLVGRDFKRPQHGWRAESLGAHLRAPRAVVDAVMTQLVDARLLTETSEQRLMPGRDPSTILLADIINAIRGADSDPTNRVDAGWDPAVERVAHELDQAIAGTLAGRTLADLVTAGETGDAARGYTTDTA